MIHFVLCTSNEFIHASKYVKDIHYRQNIPYSDQYNIFSLIDKYPSVISILLNLYKSNNACILYKEEEEKDMYGIRASDLTDDIKYLAFYAIEDASYNKMTIKQEFGIEMGIIEKAIERRNKENDNTRKTNLRRKSTNPRQSKQHGHNMQRSH